MANERDRYNRNINFTFIGTQRVLPSSDRGKKTKSFIAQLKLFAVSFLFVYCDSWSEPIVKSSCTTGVDHGSFVNGFWHRTASHISFARGERERERATYYETFRNEFILSHFTHSRMIFPIFFIKRKCQPGPILREKCSAKLTISFSIKCIFHSHANSFVKRTFTEIHENIEKRFLK